MDSWIDLLMNPKPMRAIYRGEVPPLVDLNLHEVVVYQNGEDSLHLRFDIKFPDDPPVKWSKQGFNAVQMILHLYALKNVSINGFSSFGNIDLELSKVPEGIRTAISNDDIQLTAIGANIHASTVDAYLLGRSCPSR
jgi:hypothetical protein